MSTTLALGGGEVATVFLVLMRCSGVVIATPLFGHRAVPVPLKAALAALLTIAVSRDALAAPGAMPVLLAAPIELVIGLCMGFIVSLGFHAVELGSRLLAIQMGLSLGSVLDPVQLEPGTALDPFYAIVAAVIFLALNLHLAVVQALDHSFVSLPIGGGWPSDLFILAGRLTGLTLELGVRAAMPLALVLLLAELGVALVSRAIPQINVFFLGLPLKILVGIGLAGVALPGVAVSAERIFSFVFTSLNSGTVSP